jgi:hypothetical protein
VERYPFSSRGLHKEERTVEIFSRDFAKFRGSLDLAEVQGGYREEIPKGLKWRDICSHPSEGTGGRDR